MDANEYRGICCRPDSFQRAVLAATRQILLQSHPPLAVRVRELFAGSPISKPDLHGPGKNTDYFTVKLDVADAEQIVGYLQDAEVAAVLDAEMAPVESSGRTPTKADRVAALVDAWMSYVAFREEAQSNTGRLPHEPRSGESQERAAYPPSSGEGGASDSHEAQSAEPTSAAGASPKKHGGQ